MRISPLIVLASTNRHKLEEFQALFATAEPQLRIASVTDYLRNAAKIGKAEVHATYLENAAAKARLCNQGSHYPSLGDDSGLEILSLEGRPGARSHRYAVAKSGQSQDEANIQKVLMELKGSPVREARFVCTLALVIEGVLLHATGVLDGTLTESPRGTYGFGYDSLFVPQGESRTLAEMSAGEKNKISHRARALDSLLTQVREHGIVFAKP